MAYGARLESVLGASPRGFESPILRHRTPGPLQVPGFLLLVASLALRAPSGPAAREIATRELRSEWSISKPARALRALRRPPHRRRLCRLGEPGQAPPLPTGTAARPSGPSGALHTGGTCVAWTIPASPRHQALRVLWRPAIGRSLRCRAQASSLLRLRGPRRSLRPGARPGPRPSQRASIGAGPSRCSSIRLRTPSR